MSGLLLQDAPCVCLEDATNTKTEHGRKTQAQNEWAADQRDLGTNPTYEEVREANLEAMKKAKPELQNAPGEEEHPAIECLRMVCDAYFLPMMDEETGRTLKFVRRGVASSRLSLTKRPWI